MYLQVFEHNHLSIPFQYAQDLAAFCDGAWPGVDLDVYSTAYDGSGAGQSCTGECRHRRSLTKSKHTTELRMIVLGKLGRSAGNPNARKVFAKLLRLMVARAAGPEGPSV